MRLFVQFSRVIIKQQFLLLSALYLKLQIDLLFEVI